MCRHLGPATLASLAVVCECTKGRKTSATYDVRPCAIHGECLPTYRCTAANKQAVKEEWTRSDGGDADVTTCRECRAEGLGFEPAAPG